MSSSRDRGFRNRRGRMRRTAGRPVTTELLESRRLLSADVLTVDDPGLVVDEPPTQSTVETEAANQAPVASPGSYLIGEDVLLAITPAELASDADGDDVSFDPTLLG